MEQLKKNKNEDVLNVRRDFFLRAQRAKTQVPGSPLRAEGAAGSDLEQVQGALVRLGPDGRRGVGQQLEQQLLALASEERAGLVELPPGQPRKSERQRRHWTRVRATAEGVPAAAEGNLGSLSRTGGSRRRRTP